MIVYAVIIIDEGGRPLVSQYYQSTDDAPDEVLLAAVLTAFRDLAKDVTSQKTWEVETLGMGRLFYHTKSIGTFSVFMVTNDPKCPEDLLQTIGLRFMREHPHEVIDDYYGDFGIFKEFQQMITDLLKEKKVIDESRHLKSTRRFSVGGIFDLPSDLQAAALALITLKEGTLEEISKECGESSLQTVNALNQLQKMGYIGRREKGGKQLFFYSE